MKPLHILLLIVVAAVWGFNFVVIRLGIDNFPPIFFSALRFLFASIPLAFILPRPAVSWRIIVAIGIMLGVVKFSLLFVGMSVGMPAGLASLVLQAQAFFTVILAVIVHGDRPRRTQIAGMIVAFSGIALIALTVNGDLTASGLALGVGAAVAWACSNLLMKRAGSVDMLRLMVWVSLVAPLPLLAISLVFEGWQRDYAALANLTWSGVGAVVYIAYLATIFGFAAWGAMIRTYGVATVAPFSLLVPVFGMSSAAIVLQEAFGPVRILAAILIVTGLVLNVYNPAWFSRRATAPPL